MSFGAGTSVGGTAVAAGTAVGVAVGVPHAAKTIEVNNNTNSEPICKRFKRAPFLRGSCYPEVRLPYAFIFCKNKIHTFITVDKKQTQSSDFCLYHQTLILFNMLDER
jgi:hypothetical protein